VKVNLGCGKAPLEGFVNLDITEGAGVDCVHDLDSDTPLPFSVNSVELFRMSHVLEHLRNPLLVARKLWHAATPGGIWDISVPYGSSDDAWEDPTHCRPYYLKSWGYFGQPNYWRADYGYRADWRVLQVEVVLNSQLLPWVKDLGDDAEAVLEVVSIHRNVVAEMRARLEAVKPIRPPQRELQEELKLLVTYNA
jgi:hypothetical protein